MTGCERASGTAIPAILSVQSAVAYGHVGNSAAVLPLQRLGFDVWPVNTVQLGHHPGYGQFPGHIVEPERLAPIVNGVLGRAPLADCAGMLTGYLGDEGAVDLVIEAREAIRSKCSDMVYLLDPVIGDDGPGVFVKPTIPGAIKERLLPLADIVTPNRFELALLAEQEVTDIAQARAAATKLLERGPTLVVATGLALTDQPCHLGLLAVVEDQTWLITTPKLAQHFSGTGDAFSALFLGHYLKTRDVKAALERAAAAIFLICETTADRDDAELSIIAAQDGLAEPPIRFEATKMA